MTKKILATVLAVCVLGTIVAGCNKSSDDSSGGTATATGTTGGTATATK